MVAPCTFFLFDYNQKEGEYQKGRQLLVFILYKSEVTRTPTCDFGDHNTTFILRSYDSFNLIFSYKTKLKNPVFLF